MTSPSPQLSDADLELLSAYIDRQLAAHERAALEQRLEREPELRAALDELRTTVALLHDLAPARPPRSFALDPAVAQRRRFELPGWLSGLWLAPALVAVICALAVTALFVGGGTATPVMQPAAGDFQAAVAATPAPALAEDSAPESAAAPAPAAEALAPEGAGAPVAASAATPAPESAPAAAAPPPAEVGAAATAQADMMLGEAPAGGAPAMSTAEAQALEPRIAEEPAQASAATPEPAPLATSGVVASETLRLPPPEPGGTPAQPPAGGGPNPALWIAILALIVLLGLGGVWVARRRR